MPRGYKTRAKSGEYREGVVEGVDVKLEESEKRERCSRAERARKSDPPETAANTEREITRAPARREIPIDPRAEESATAGLRTC